MDVEMDRVAGRKRKKEDRDEREKDRGKYGNDREEDYDREKYREKEYRRNRDKKARGKDRDREKEREMLKDSDRAREKEWGKNKTRDKAKEREQGKYRDKEKEEESYKDGERDTRKDKIRKERETDQDKVRSGDRVRRKAREEDCEFSNVDDKVECHEKRDEKVSKQVKASKLNEDDQDGETSAHLSSKQLEEGILKMKETRTKKQSEAASVISAWVNKSRKLVKERALHLSNISKEQDSIAVEGSDVEDTTHHTDHLAGVKVLHGLDKVMEGGTVVLTIKDQPILADGDINEEVDKLESMEIGEQKWRDEAYKAVKKKTSIYDDKFSDDPSVEKKILPQYDDLAAEEGFTLDERRRFSGEAEKKPEELRRRLTGVSANDFEDLTSSGKVSSDYYSHEEMPQFQKSKRKKSLRKKDKLDINALEAEAISSGLGVGDLGSQKDAKRQAMKDEQERLEAEMRNNVYQSAFAKEDVACKLLHQTFNVKAEEDETPAFTLFAISVVEEFVRRHQISEEAHKREREDVFIQDDEEANAPNEKKNDKAGGWTEVKETNKDEQPSSEDKNMVPDDTIHEVAIGKGLSGALKLLNFIGILDGEGKEEQNKNEIDIERTDEFGKILTRKEAFRMDSHKFHGKGPGKMKQEKRMKQHQDELKMKQMKSSDTPSLSVERMREVQVLLKTPYLVLSGHVNQGRQTSDPNSGFATVEKDLTHAW